MKPTAKVTTTNTAIPPLYKLLIVCLLAVFLLACDDDNKPVTYTVTFDTDGGNPEVTSQTVKSGEQAQQPSVKPTKADSVVVGWINTANDQAYDFATPVTANLALKAVYAKVYKITFNTNGGKAINPVEVPQGGSVAPPVPPPTREGKFFDGWYEDAGFNTRYDFSQQVTSSDTLYARWSDYNIPDEKFRAYLKSRVASAFSGDQLQADHPEVKALTAINVSGQGIVSLEGIQYFIGLTELDGSSNQLNVLDVSANTALTSLSCQSNQLASLDMRTNKDLTTLDVSSNDKLARVFVHEDMLCLQGLKGIFEANRLSLEMLIESYKDDGELSQSYDENAYSKACFETTPTYTVTFDTDRGASEAVKSQNVKSGEKAQQPTVEPTKTDSVFIHWINTANDRPYDFSTPVTANLNLKAVYAKTYKVTFDAVGGMPEVETQTIASGNQAQEPTVKPTKPDSVVTGWINTANDRPYDFSAPVTADLNLKANYSKTYKVTFDADGGMPEVETQTIASGSRAQEPSVKPTKGELVLKDWVNTADGEPYNFFTLVRSDLNLQAVYAKAYTVRFDTDGGSSIGDEKVVDGDTLFARLSPTKTGEFFAGWYTDDTFTIPYNFNTPVTASITLYARWSSNNIPDDTFRAYLKGIILNAFNGEQLQTDHRDVKELKTIDVSGQGIISLEGIQYFTGLTELKCDKNQLSSLDVSTNTALKALYCSSNQLSSLDVANNTALTILYCSSNQLSSLDVSTNTALTSLSCQTNQLSSLDVVNNRALEELECYYNELISLDVSGATALNGLYCEFNQLSSLDVSANRALTSLACSYNQLTSLNIRNNKNLTTLRADRNNQLAEISVHESKLCDAGITESTGIKGIFEANKGSLEMMIISYDDNGAEVQFYDEDAYEEACK